MSDTDPNARQAETIAFLRGGAGLGTCDRMIETHGALVFLIGEHALKIKRAVRYDYLDFSTLQKRHDVLQRELELNQPTAPQIYHDVIAVLRTASGTLSFEGDGEVLEWVLTMTRFPAEDELVNIAHRGGIDADLAQALGASIARYHQSTPVRHSDGAVLIADIVAELDRVLADMHATFDGLDRRFLALCRQAIAGQARALSDRARQGHVRRCHGDLHLGNIVVLDGVPTPYDALEFDERLGTCDTLYDLAFLLMDLMHQDLAPAANLVFNSYLGSVATDISQAGLRHLPLFLAIRAAIRAMVAVQTAALASAPEPASGSGPAPHTDALADARDYLSQAVAYMAPPAARLVVIGGFSGTGKTTLARALAPAVGAAPGAVHVRSDVTRKILLHKAPLTRLGPSGYTAAVSRRTYAEIARQAREVLQQGHSVVLDAVHGTADTRTTAEQIAQDLGCGFVGFWLEAGDATRRARVQTRAPDASDADAEVVRTQSQADPGPIDWIRVDTDRPLQAVHAEMAAWLTPAREAVRTTSGDADAGQCR